MFYNVFTTVKSVWKVPGLRTDLSEDAEMTGNDEDPIGQKMMIRAGDHRLADG
jgi:hypothetical protein